MGYVYAVLAVFFWSFNVIVAKYFVDTFTPWQISFYRWFFASVILFPFVVKEIYKNGDIYFKYWKKVLLYSLFGIILMNTFSYVAAQTISAVEMSLIGVMGPVFIVILSRIFLKIKVSKLQIIGIALSFLGVVVIILHGHILKANLTFKIGDLWMLMLALSFGIYSVLMTKKPKEFSQTGLLSMMIFVGTIFILPLFIWQTIHSPVCDKWDMLTVGTLVYMGLFNSVISYLCWNLSIEKIGSLKSSVIYYLMPVFSSIEAYFLLGEEIYSSQIYGGMLVLLGIYLTNRKSKSKS